jgi:SAM-dependent methyltransferase
MRALDLGCATGADAVRLARLGIHVTLLDSPAAMLALAEREIVEAGANDKITVKRGDAAIGGHFADGIVRYHSLSQPFGIPRQPWRRAMRRRACPAGSVGDTVRPRTQSGEKSKVPQFFGLFEFCCS